MDVIAYKSKDLLPGILLDKESGKFQFYGQSCPEDAVEFYAPIFDWFDQYKEDPLKSTTLDFNMSYFNTVTAKVFFMIMTKLENLHGSGHDVNIRWYYPDGDEDLEEAGEEFESIFNLNFECIPVKGKKNETENVDIDAYLDDLI